MIENHELLQSVIIFFILITVTIDSRLKVWEKLDAGHSLMIKELTYLLVDGYKFHVRFFSRKQKQQSIPYKVTGYNRRKKKRLGDQSKGNIGYINDHEYMKIIYVNCG